MTDTEFAFLGIHYSLTTYPAWFDGKVNEDSIPTVLSSLCTKSLFMSDGDKYVGSPIIEYLFFKMQNSKIWLSIPDIYFVYFDSDITISIYRESDNRVIVTPYEKPSECFTSIKVVICDDAEYVFIADESSHNIKTAVEKLRSMWEGFDEQRQNNN